jgi:hypothetical protein
MVRISAKSFWFGCPYFADIFVRGEALEGLESLGEVVCGHEVSEVPHYQPLIDNEDKPEPWHLDHGAVGMLSRRYGHRRIESAPIVD